MNNTIETTLRSELQDEFERCYERFEVVKLSLCRYIFDGVAPGDFLQAVLSNDLQRAIAHADAPTLTILKPIVMLVFNDVPSKCWGKREIVKDWIGEKHDVLRASYEWNIKRKRLDHYNAGLLTKLQLTVKEATS